MSKQNIFENLHSIRDFIRWGASRFIEAGLFFCHGTTNAFEDAEFLVLDALHIDPPLDDVWLDSRLTLD